MIQQSCTQLKLLRADVDEYSHRIFEHSCRIAAHSKIAATMPRVIQRQAHRSNPELTSVEEYYKRAIVIPFLDHLINEITCRFDTHTKQVASIQGLLPVRITSDFPLLDIQEAIDFYTSDLPNAEVIDEEVHIWKSRWLSSSLQERPQTLSDSLKVCSPETLPNLFTLLKLFATLPLSSCSCERSASTLR